MSMRIGYGYDFHRYTSERPLYIGGFKIDHQVGLMGHSDADVLLHAISDALLGALALGDIGKYFPDTDPKYKNANSRALLRAVVAMIQEMNFDIVNIDSTVVADHPKLAPHINEMRQRIAADLGVSADCVGVKATTQEGLGEAGISARAVVLLAKSSEDN